MSPAWRARFRHVVHDDERNYGAGLGGGEGFGRVGGWGRGFACRDSRLGGIVGGVLGGSRRRSLSRGAGGGRDVTGGRVGLGKASQAGGENPNERESKEYAFHVFKMVLTFTGP